MKVLYILLGSITLVLGVLGTFVPLLPTTPFLLLSAALYCRSSRRLYGWLMTNPLLGPYISNYRLKRAMTLSTKIVSLTLLWGSILSCILFVTDLLWLRILLGAVLVGVTAHILSFRTIRNGDVLKITKVRTPACIVALAALADEIWHEYYSPLIGAEQVDYMLSRMQSAEAIARQIEAEGYEYYFINYGGRNAGYMGIRIDRKADSSGGTKTSGKVLTDRKAKTPDKAQSDRKTKAGLDIKTPGGSLFLSKFYILKSERGRGYARESLLFLTHLCLRHGLKSIWLTVNRDNRASVDVYLKSGFKVVGEEVTDIGGGFVMDDLIMEKDID